jgi:putative ABC transport system substrate-binding protein
MNEKPWLGVLNAISDNRKSKIENLKLAGILALALTFAFGGTVAPAQQPTKIPRIGYLSAGNRSAQTARIEAFIEGFRELGYVEGKNIVIEWRWAEGKYDRVPELVAEMVRLKVDVIVSAGPLATRAAKEGTTTIPIVMAQDNDPVGSGVVASLARPGGNITGLSSLSPELSGKQLELLKEIVPKLSRLAVFGYSKEPGNAQSLKEVELAAKAFGVKVQYLEITSPKDIDTAFRTAVKGSANGLLVLATQVLVSQRAQVAELAVKSRLLAIYPYAEFVQDGGLMSYGTSYADLYRRATTYVDKILKGRAPADLPVEQPIKFEFIVNLKAAKQIGLTIPPNVLARADRVLK